MLIRPIFNSTLPVNIDWQEISTFLKNSAISRSILSKTWFGSDAFKNTTISENSLNVLICLHKDLNNCYYGGIFAAHKNGRENRSEEYELLMKNLFSKYSGISEDILDNIYHNYLLVDR